MSEKLLIAYVAAAAAITGAIFAVFGAALGAFLTWRANLSLEAIKLKNTEFINNAVESIRLVNTELSSIRELKRDLISKMIQPREPGASGRERPEMQREPSVGGWLAGRSGG